MDKLSQATDLKSAIFWDDSPCIKSMKNQWGRSEVVKFMKGQPYQPQQNNLVTQKKHQFWRVYSAHRTIKNGEFSIFEMVTMAVYIKSRWLGPPSPFNMTMENIVHVLGWFTYCIICCLHPDVPKRLPQGATEVKARGLGRAMGFIITWWRTTHEFEVGHMWA